MLTKVVAENSLERIGRVLSVWLVALMLGWVATAVAGPAEDLVKAATDGDAAAVQALLAKGADLDARDNDGWTALMLASQNGHLDVVQALLAKGVKNAQRSKTVKVLSRDYANESSGASTKARFQKSGSS